MARTWTEAQKSAIDDRGNTLLVSAAAGSGKTAVLTARILARLTEEGAELDLSRLLAVTFTKAAAEELRERIGGALQEEMAKDPGNKRIAGQLMKLPGAKISTIHSFCYQLIRTHFDRLGLSAGVRIGDDAEMKVLGKKLMNEIIDGYYDGDPGQGFDDIADFAALTDLFITDRDEKLPEIFLKLYDKLQGYTRGVEYLSDFAAELMVEEDFFAGRYGLGLLSMAREEVARHRGNMERACAYFARREDFAEHYLPSFEAEKDYCDRLLAALARYDAGLLSLLDSYESVPLGRGVKKADQTEESDYFRDCRDELHKYIVKLRDKILPSDPEGCRACCRQTAEVCMDLCRILTRYSQAMAQEKKRRGIVDYGDLERMALQLLYEDGQPSAVAKELQEYYQEIYIDEYQDVNQVQDSIFRAIAREDDLFMVGDIKQSIYGFRGAAPDIFAGYRAAYPKYDKNGEKGKYTVFLSNNFRCDEPIIAFSNAVFACLFGYGGTIGYEAEDALICSKIGGDEDTVPVTVALFSNAAEEDGEGDDADDTDSSEAMYVANEIAALIGQGYRAGDIAILLRSAKSSGPRFEQALEAVGVRYENAAATDFFENAEVRLMICLLSIIDDPMRDIELTGALMSPLFRFTLDELIRVRQTQKEGALYEALEQYTAETGFEKGRAFLDSLARYRSYAEGQPVDKLIWYLYNDTGLLDICGDPGQAASPEAARANLMLFYDYARSYESGSFQGLYRFIYYIEDIIADKNSLEQAKNGGDSEACVKIMTVHQSKGLEFPVCFLCDTGRGFNKQDSRENIILDSDYGFAVKLRDETGLARYNTPLRTASLMNLERRQAEEEMRVLYVALTRARERLYVTASLKDPEKTLSACRMDAMAPGRALFLRQQRYIKWILTALFADAGERGYCRILFPEAMVTAVGEKDTVEEKAAVDPAFLATVERFRELFRERFAYEYPYAEATRTPAKLAVSGLYPEVLDGEEEEAAALPEAIFGTAEEEAAIGAPAGAQEKAVYLPRFLQDEKEKSRSTAAERGTATHVCMQFCDLDYAEQNGVDAEIARQIARGFMTPQMAELVWRGQIAAFFRSPLYRRMRMAEQRGELMREYRFNVKLSAADFTADAQRKQRLRNEFILVQGVVDAIFREEGGYYIVDYKTDYAERDPDGGITAAAAMLRQRHRLQLDYYRQACEKITGEKVCGIYLYSFCLGEAIEID